MNDRAAEIIRLALNGTDNAAIAAQVRVRPRRVREVVAAAIREGVDIAGNRSTTVPSATDGIF